MGANQSPPVWRQRRAKATGPQAFMTFKDAGTCWHPAASWIAMKKLNERNAKVLTNRKYMLYEI